MNSKGARSREAREKEREGGKAGETERYGEGGAQDNHPSQKKGRVPKRSLLCPPLPRLRKHG